MTRRTAGLGILVAPRRLAPTVHRRASREGVAGAGGKWTSLSLSLYSGPARPCRASLVPAAALRAADFRCVPRGGGTGRSAPPHPSLPLPLSPINLRYPPLSLVLRAATPPMQQRRLQPSWADSYSIRPPQLAIRLWIATARASALSAAPPWPRGALRLPQAAASEWRLRECRNGFRAPRLAPAEGGAARNAHVFPVCGAERASRSGTCDQPRIPCAPSAARASPFPGFPVATSVTQRRGRLESVAARRARRVPQAP